MKLTDLYIQNLNETVGTGSIAVAPTAMNGSKPNKRKYIEDESEYADEPLDMSHPLDVRDNLNRRAKISAGELKTIGIQYNNNVIIQIDVETADEEQIYTLADALVAKHTDLNDVIDRLKSRVDDIRIYKRIPINLDDKDSITDIDNEIETQSQTNMSPVAL